MDRETSPISSPVCAFDGLFFFFQYCKTVRPATVYISSCGSRGSAKIKPTPSTAYLPTKYLRYTCIIEYTNGEQSMIGILITASIILLP